jgi:hypothetical protein
MIGTFKRIDVLNILNVFNGLKVLAAGGQCKEHICEHKG